VTRWLPDGDPALGRALRGNRAPTCMDDLDVRCRVRSAVFRVLTENNPAYQGHQSREKTMSTNATSTAPTLPSFDGDNMQNTTAYAAELAAELTRLMCAAGGRAPRLPFHVNVTLGQPRSACEVPVKIEAVGQRRDGDASPRLTVFRARAFPDPCDPVKARGLIVGLRDGGAFAEDASVRDHAEGVFAWLKTWADCG
jgi:hypothetical protein